MPPPLAGRDFQKLGEYAYQEFLRISVTFDGIVADGGGIAVAWGDITGKPTEFTPSAHNHSASEITSGTINTARLGSGTANSSTVLYGDSVWRAVSSGYLEFLEGYTGTCWDFDAGDSAVIAPITGYMADLDGGGA